MPYDGSNTSNDTPHFYKLTIHVKSKMWLPRTGNLAEVDYCVDFYCTRVLPRRGNCMRIYSSAHQHRRRKQQATQRTKVTRIGESTTL